jgi:hypothetical protein
MLSCNPHSLLEGPRQRSPKLSFNLAKRENFMSGRFRLKSPTLALLEEEGRHVARTIPADAIVAVESVTFDGNKLVGVMWDGTRLMMFAQDLRSRAEPID